MKKGQKVRFVGCEKYYDWGDCKPDQSVGIVDKKYYSGYLVILKTKNMEPHPSFAETPHFFGRKYIEPLSPPWYTRLYRGIMGALFGPESHAVNRYENKEAAK